MFNYYGSKSKIAKLYPCPQFDLIIEPFAGAAYYSVNHIQHKAWLNDKYRIVYEIWDWLIRHATQEQILLFSDFWAGDDIRSLDLCQQHRNLIGFCINRGSASPSNIVQKWSCQSQKAPSYASTTNYRLNQIARLLPKIKTWVATCMDYKSMPNIEATWFIDPPYQKGGEHYHHHDIDYKFLSDWCRSRKGQVIVCKKGNATWLNFKTLAKTQGQKGTQRELIYTQSK